MEFSILGPIEARDGQGTVQLGAPKQRAVLGVLLLHANEVVSTARLVDELWGTTPPATAEKLVQGYVHALRKTLGEGVVETRSPGYRLALGGRSLDIGEFERLVEEARRAPLPQAVELRRRALALWRGAPLEDIAFEGPAQNEVARLRELRLATQIEQVDAQLELGLHAEIVGELEALVAEHPYAERLHGQLMLALYRSGRQAEALDVYSRFRRDLDEQLGLQPNRELRGLEQAILRQDEGLSSPATPEPGLPPTTSDTSRPRWPRRAALALAALVLLGLLAAGLLRDRDGPSVVAPPNSIAAIDPASNRVVDAVEGVIRPGPLAAGAGSLWVGNLDDRTLTRIDLETRQVVKTIPLPATPDGIAVDGDTVWVVHGRLGTITRVDSRFDTVAGTYSVAARAVGFPTGAVAVGEGSVWAVFGDSTLARIDRRSGRTSGSVAGGEGPAGVVVAFGSVWVSSSGDATVRRFNPATFEEGPIAQFTVGRSPAGIAAGDDAIWVANEGAGGVTRIDADIGFNSADPIRTGDGPTSVAAGDGTIWVSNTSAGTVSRIDPRRNEVIETVQVGAAPAGVVVANGLVWVSVQAP